MQKYEKPSKVNLKKINWETFTTRLRETDARSQVNYCEDVNEKIDSFQNSLLELAQKLDPKSERVPIHLKQSVR